MIRQLIRCQLLIMLSLVAADDLPKILSASLDLNKGCAILNMNPLDKTAAWELY